MSALFSEQAWLGGLELSFADSLLQIQISWDPLTSC